MMILSTVANTFNPTVMLAVIASCYAVIALLQIPKDVYAFTTIQQQQQQYLQHQQLGQQYYVVRNNILRNRDGNRIHELRHYGPLYNAIVSDTEQETNEQQQQQQQLISSDSNIYELLGIQEGQLALGVKPDEVYKNIGTREDLITKTMTDIPTLSREMAEEEVDRFLLDCEMVNLYIQYGKEVERDPNFTVPDNDNDKYNNNWFTPQNIVFGYVGYVAVTSVPKIVRRIIAEQQVDGTWKPTNIPFIDDWIETTSDDAIARVLQRAADKAAAAAADGTSSVDAAVSVDAVVSAPVVDVVSSSSSASSSLSDSIDTVMTTISTSSLLSSSSDSFVHTILDTFTGTTTTTIATL